MRLRKILLVSIVCMCCLASYGQQEFLIKKALADTSNFRVLRFWNKGEKMPKHIYVFDTTTQWRPERLYMEGLEQSKAKWSLDEHHPYNHSYLFRDTALDKLFTATEKQALAQKAAALQSRKLSLKTSFASTVPSFRSVKSGFVLWVTDPVYSTDGNYAFVDFTVLEKRPDVSEINEAYHSSVCVVFKKEDGEWKKWKLRPHIIL